MLNCDHLYEVFVKSLCCCYSNSVFNLQDKLCKAELRCSTHHYLSADSKRTLERLVITYWWHDSFLMTVIVSVALHFQAYRNTTLYLLALISAFRARKERSILVWERIKRREEKESKYCRKKNVPEGFLSVAEVACFCASLECEQTIKALTHFLCLS